jgi:hypothetical protein
MPAQMVTFAAVLRIRRPFMDSMVEVSTQLQLVIANSPGLAKRPVRMRDSGYTSGGVGGANEGTQTE